MVKVDFPTLYRLQDKVLSVVFSIKTEFYLTGGTCLHRFYQEQRYSDDLDLFSNDNQLFRDDVRLVRRSLDDAAISLDIVVDSRDFVRFIVADLLKVNLVNDRVYRIGSSVRTGSNIMLDNIDNIGANKICAVLGRDDPKDIFDLYTIFRSSAPNWPDIVSAADRKCAFDMEELRFRLESFPLSLIDMLQVTDSSFVSELQRDYRLLVDCILSAC
jgi:predicted nucleotidyltransferase component of viral defense system